MIIAGVRFNPLIISLFVAFLGTLVHRATNGMSMSMDPSSHLGVLALVVLSWLVIARAQQSELRCLFDAQRCLAVKSNASAKLLSTVCDAACWLAADGSTILESDPRVDEVLGCKAQGTDFVCYLPDEEKKRFHMALVSAGTRHVLDPVVLLPSTLRGAGSRQYEMDLFIEDVRAEWDASEGRNLPGFLVGIRLAVPEQAASSFMTECDLEAPVKLLRRCDQIALESDAASSRNGETMSLPETLRSAQLPYPIFQTCTQEALHRALYSGTGDADVPTIECPLARDTVLATLELICNHALGGALVCIAEAKAFEHVFGAEVPNAACTRSSDQGYMTDYLRGIHVRDARFQDAFREFTRPTHNDRWPEDYPDELARGRPKDGAFLLSMDGYRVQCSAKLLGLAPVARWESVGTKHEAALACAWAIPGAFVFVKSDSGSLHFVQRAGTTLHVYQVES
eukprot:CAMPEP_0115554558 /NCGR_PEP_ID=MMETSP0271-20121206/97356_1 /TAXON_ID=71861 /ORGANISM="Scrippsiella trochoidea, Strain CCMP3099" /LENGTH=453 /DNA_ID=CAMNT_0002988289 /DNA_START=313 /DNA_END=1674 /DNA_ORIENTATION=-